MAMRNFIFDIKASSPTSFNIHNDTDQVGKKFTAKDLWRIKLCKILLVQIRAGQKLSCYYFTRLLKAYHLGTEQEKVKRTEIHLSGILSHILSVMKGEVRRLM